MENNVTLLKDVSEKDLMIIGMATENVMLRNEIKSARATTKLLVVAAGLSIYALSQAIKKIDRLQDQMITKEIEDKQKSE